MDSEEKTLLCISSLEDCVRVQCNINDSHEMLEVCTVLADYMHSNDLFCTMLLGAFKYIEENPETDMYFSSTSVDVPDFNKLLKDLKNE